MEAERHDEEMGAAGEREDEIAAASEDDDSRISDGDEDDDASGSDDDSAASSSSEDWEYGEEEMMDANMWSRIKANDPHITSIDFSWEDEAGFVPNLDWRLEGRHFADITSLKELNLVGVRDSDTEVGFYTVQLRSVEEPNLLHCLRGIALNRSIEHLHLSGCNFSGNRWLSLLWPFFEHNTNLRGIAFWDCYIYGASLEMALAKINRRSLEYLIFENIHPGEEIISRLRPFANLSTLTLNGRNYGRDTYIALADLLQDPRCGIKDLSISRSSIRRLRHLFLILKALVKNNTVTTLNLAKNWCLSDEGWYYLFEDASWLPLSLRSLDLSENNIDDEAIARFGHTFDYDNSLQVLDIGRSEYVTEDGWKAFLSILHKSRHSLRSLHLDGNCVGEDGMHVLGKILASSTSLAHLHLKRSGLTNSGLTALSYGLVRSQLQSLDLAANRNVSAGGWRNFFSGVFANPRSKSASTLQHICLERNRVDDDGIDALVSSLLGNSCSPSASAENMSSMEILNLAHNSVSPLGVQRLANLLKSRNCKLRELNVIDGDDNTVTARGWAALSNALCNRSSIDATYSSNHALAKLCVLADEDDVLPRDLVSLLVLNRGYTGREVARERILQYSMWEGKWREKSSSKENRNNTPEDSARLKILRCHLLAEDGADIDAFIGMKCNVMPRAIAWAGRDDEGFPVLYQILRSMPSLLRMNVEGTGLKRKRAEERDG